MPLSLKSGAHTVAGRREHNEDALRIKEDAGVFVIADGAGGRASGQVAARIACDVVIRELNAALEQDDVRSRIDRAVREAHQKIQEKQSDPKLQGMATTIVILVARGEQAHVAHVGDSRAYLSRRGELRALTRDHSLANYLADNPHIKPKVERPGDTLVRALGLKSADGQRVDHATLDLEPNDTILLCSDGLSSFLPEWTIGAILSGAGFVLESGIAESLIRGALAHGSMDNATAVVVHAEDGSRARRTLGWLTFLEGPRQGDVIELGRTSHIGGDEGCDVVISDPDASPRHVKIELAGSAFAVRDLGAKGGTFINDVAVEDEVLVDGDVIRVGGTRMVFKCHRLV